MCHPSKDSIQFGEGNFLRAFVDYSLQLLNEQTEFSGKVSIVQPLPQGMIEQLRKQNGKYHVFSEGVLEGQTLREVQAIDCIDKLVNPYQDFEAYLQLAENENLTFIFSNTTEAGIALNEKDPFDKNPPNSFPGKLTRLLHHRYKKFDGDPTKVLHIIPCELIDKNGSKLKDIILQLCDIWQLEKGFKDWILQNHFYNTLVDRIVPGYPKEDLDYYQKNTLFDDALMVTCEPFFLWVIEGNPKLLELFPAHQLKKINVTVVPDLGIYRTRKVRILNGSHTSLVPVGLLHGSQTVTEALNDPFLKNFLSEALFKEIIPSIDFDKRELEDYAHSVLERFANPYVKHLLESISLNSISKFKVRVLPSLLAYHQKQGAIPQNLTFAMAALIYFYGKSMSKHSIEIKDDDAHLRFFESVWQDNTIAPLVEKTLSNRSLWDQDLNKVSGLSDTLEHALNTIVKQPTISNAYQVFKSKIK
jgi:tagaturonate reductase